MRKAWQVVLEGLLMVVAWAGCIVVAVLLARFWLYFFKGVAWRW